MTRRIRLTVDDVQSDCLLILPKPYGLLDFKSLFGNDRPVELEVGFGKGLFLLNSTVRQPQTNFLGIEIEIKYTLYTAQKLARQQRHNVKVLAADAKEFLPACIADDSLQAVHVYFPDPWWKTRHRKRRLFTVDFAQQVERILKPGGMFYLASDVHDYFLKMNQILRQATNLQELPPPELTPAADEFDYLTNFERKYRREGRPIHRSQYQKISVPSS